MAGSGARFTLDGRFISKGGLSQERSISMVTEAKKGNDAKKRQKVKAGGPKLNKETVKNLSDGELKKVQGGRIATVVCGPSALCKATIIGC